MNDQDLTSTQWDTSAPRQLDLVSDALRNDYFYQHRPHEHFNRSLAILRMLTTRADEMRDLAQGLNEAWILGDPAEVKPDDDAGVDVQNVPFVLLQGLTLKFQVIETLLRHFLAHHESPRDPWSHISQLRVPRDFSERVRRLRLMEHEQRTPLVEWVFFGVTEAQRAQVSVEQHEWMQQVIGVDMFFEMCLRCWLEDQGPFLAVKHGYVAMPHELSSVGTQEEVGSESDWSSWLFHHITRGDAPSGWEIQAARSDVPNVVAAEVYFASRLLRQLLDVGRIRNVPSETRTIDVIWWDDELREGVRNGTLDITDGPPPTRPWTVPLDT